MTSTDTHISTAHSKQEVLTDLVDLESGESIRFGDNVLVKRSGTEIRVEQPIAKTFYGEKAAAQVIAGLAR